MSKRMRRLVVGIVCFHGAALLAALLLLAPSCTRKNSVDPYNQVLSADDHIEMTKSRMKLLAGIIQRSFSSQFGYPESLAELAQTKQLKNSPHIVRPEQSIFLDSWAHEFQYRVSKDRMSFSLTSFASDGAPGGLGAAEDIQIEAPGEKNKSSSL